MDFAADAVLDVVTPTSRQILQREPGAAQSDEPSFDDHLQAASKETDAPQNPEVLPAPHQPVVETIAEASDPALSLLGGEIAPSTTPQPAAQQASAPVLLQLITAMLSPAQQDSAKPQTVTPTGPTLPVDASANAPAAPTPAAAPVASDAQKSATPAVAEATPADAAAPNAEKSAAPTDKSATPTAQTPQTAPAPAQTQTAQMLPVPVSTTPSAPTAEEQTAAAAIGAIQAQPAPEQAARHAKPTPARGEAKIDETAPQDRALTSPATAPPRGNAKAAAPQNAAKDALAFTPLDAPEAAPAQQASSSAPAAAAASAQAQHAVAEESVARAAPAAQQVGREIVRRFDGGNTRFELRLDPPELGRVEVRLEISRDHRVSAVIAADSPHALTELARHARELEQMLHGAGLELGDNGLSFDLRQGSERSADAHEFGAARGEAAAQTEDAAPVAARPIGYERWRGVRVDVMV